MNKFWLNLKIIYKLFIGFGVVIILIIAIGVTGYHQLNVITDNYNRLISNSTTRSNALLQVGRSYARFRRIAATAVIEIGNEKSLKLLEEEYLNEKNNIQNQFKKYIIALESDTKLHLDDKESLRSSIIDLEWLLDNQYDKIIKNIFDNTYKNKSKEAMEALNEALEITSVLDQKLNNLIFSALDFVEEAYEESLATARIGEVFSVGFLILAVVFSVAYSFFVSNLIRQGIKQVTDGAIKISEGDFDVEVGSLYKDEIAQLSNSLLKLKTVIHKLSTDLKNVSKSFEAGDIDARIDLSQYKGEFYEISKSVNDNLASMVEDVLYALKLVRDFGDGIFDDEVKELPGKKILLTNSFRSVRKTFKKMNSEITSITAQAADGNLDIRIDVEVFKGEWHEIASRINRLLVEVIRPIREAIAILNQMADGNLDVSLKGEYKGEFELMKYSLNNTLSIISAKVDERTRELTIMTERANKEAQAKSEFLVSMSHEIRTPMNAIIGMSEILSLEKMDKKQKDYVKDIKEASQSLLNIINDILDISKIESGKFSLLPTDYNLPLLIENIADMMGYVAKEKQLEFNMQLPENIPFCLFGDDNRLRQVLTNIIGNAIKFTQKGGVDFRVIAKKETICFEVEDTGIGIKEEDIAKLFDVFEQLDEIKNRSTKGSGLGLSISKDIVKMMGGAITVSSRYGKGTVFGIEIPLIVGDPEKIAQQNKTISFVKAPDAKVLLVDDDQTNINVGKGLLELSSIICDTAKDGIEAVEKIEQNDYDIVFMDHMMPKMDGVEATKSLRAKGGRYAALPIIALSANAFESSKDIFSKAGMNDFLPKPIDLQKLNTILSKWLPKEKQQGFEVYNIGDDDQSDFITRAKAIAGLEVEEGLARVAGQEDIYFRSLRIISKNIPKLAQNFKLYLSENEPQKLKSFAIEVHGIKGSLASIGNKSLAEEASKLEDGAKNQDFDYCKGHISGFVTRLLEFGSDLSALVSSLVLEEVETGEIDFNKLLDIKARIKSDCLAFDQDEALEKTQTLLGISKQIDKFIAELTDALESFDFEKAVEIIEQAG